jgi:hypothetical protein
MSLSTVLNAMAAFLAVMTASGLTLLSSGRMKFQDLLAIYCNLIDLMFTVRVCGSWFTLVGL